jgi:hypothetical protein
MQFSGVITYKMNKSEAFSCRSYLTIFLFLQWEDVCQMPKRWEKETVFLCGWLVAPNHNSPPHLEYTFKSMHLLRWRNWQSSNTLAAICKAWVCDGWLAGTGGFEYPREHGYLSLVNVVCCEAEVSAMGRSLVQRSLTVCACVCVFVSECYIKIWTMRRPRPTRAVKPWKYMLFK